MVYIKNVTAQPQRYTMQVSYPGGVYVVGLKAVEAGQTATFDLRLLRDNQVPDSDGRVMPPEATHGRLKWSVYGREDRVLVGRAEQVDIAHGMSMTSACPMCCPASFYNGWVEPGEVVGFPGETTQFLARERDRDCYGTIDEPYTVWPAAFSSDNPEVAECQMSGLTTARTPGVAGIHARWEAPNWLSAGGYCKPSPLDILRNALCDVLRTRDLAFRRVTYSDLSASFDFELSRDTATLNLGGAGGGVCTGSTFEVVIEFIFPRGGTMRDRDDPLNRVVTGGDNQFEYTAWDFRDISSTQGTGKIFIRLFRRRPANPRNYVDINLTGHNPPGTTGDFGGRGRVHLVCP